MNRLEDQILRPLGARLLERTFDKTRGKIEILARTACMGDDLLARCFRKSRVSVQKYQKLRVDQFAAFLDKSKFMTSFNEYLEFSASVNSLPNLPSRLLGEFFTRDPREALLESDFVILDSFCELVDRKWSINNGLYAYGTSSDYEGLAKSDGLIDIDVFDNSLNKIIHFSQKQNVSRPIVWLHYSANNDGREQYRRRSQELLEVALEKSKNYESFHVVKLPDDQYDFSERDFLPYHYGKTTMGNLKLELIKILSKYKIYSSRYTFKFD